MQTTTSLTLAFLLLLPSACASAQRTAVSQEPLKKPLRGGVAEFRLTSYDGGDLRGRFLIGATIDTLVIDGRLFEDRTLELKKARACGTSEVREHYIVDRFAPPEPNEIVTLPKGYWHGSDVYFFLWDKETGLGPDCLEAELIVHTLDSRVAATLPIKVVRTDKPPATPPGVAEEPKTPAPEDRTP